MSSVLEQTSQSAARTLPPRNGDVLDQVTFHTRYLAMPKKFRAELIGGVVHVPSPVTNWHCVYHAAVVGWLFNYAARLPGVEAGDNGTVILDEENEPQPDAFLRLDQSVGGASHVSEDGYVVGPPELHVEVAYTSASIDLHQKRLEYERTGVQEYVVVQIEEQAIRAFRRQDGAYVEVPFDADGIWRSSVFPGLWLNVRALLDRDGKTLLETLQRGIESAEHKAFVERLQHSAH